ncbi:MAG TPA: divalent-cation tolerance protein CutA [Kofleriaceae bacterium]|nr:divalent-cation tolerance protein CutA [Kofleriaceae bacterium]
MSAGFAMVYCTFPDGDTAAKTVAGAVRLRLAACANIIAGVRSIYRWKDEIHDDTESLAIFKTTNTKVDALRDHLIANHPYDCPEVIAVPVTGGSPAYLSWLAASVDPAGS